MCFVASKTKSAQLDRSATVVILVRHGHTPTTGKILPGRTKGLHLSDLGKEQAEKVASHLSSLNSISAVYSSPMERTFETAKPIAKAFGKSVLKHQGLIEADFGKWTGRKLSELRKLKDWEKVQKNPSLFRFPDGESFMEMQSRMVTTVTNICENHRGNYRSGFTCRHDQSVSHRCTWNTIGPISTPSYFSLFCESSNFWNPKPICSCC